MARANTKLAGHGSLPRGRAVVKKPRPARSRASDEENKKDVERLIRLCIELDAEMDGVRVPATAAAVLNGIRSVLQKYA